MQAVLPWALLQGLAALMLSGALLALVAVVLPRWLTWWEKGEAARLGLEAPAPALPVGERPAPVEVPAPGPRPPLVAPVAAPEEPLVAAAIGLALALYQEEPREGRTLPQAAGPSPWALAGRWQVMQGRISLPKR